MTLARAVAEIMRISAEAVELRAAAQDFAKDHPIEDSKDSAGLKRWQRLARASVAFTKARAALRKAGVGE